MIGRESTKDYLEIFDNNELRNCPIEISNIVAAEVIIGTEVGSLQGDTVCSSSAQMTHLKVNIPPHLYERYKEVSLSIDIMFINKVDLFMTKIRNLRFGSSGHITSRNQKIILTCIKKLGSAYQLGGLNITHINSDKELEPLRAELADMHIYLNAASDDEHVGNIERYIRTTKERVSSIRNTYPFQKVLHRTLIEFVE